MEAEKSEILFLYICIIKTIKVCIIKTIKVTLCL